MARQRVTMRGQFSSASGSSQAKPSRPARSSSTVYATGSLPAASASSARSSGLRSKVGYEGIQPARAAAARQSAAVMPANAPRPSGEARTSARKRS